MRFMLIDRVTSIALGESISGIKCITFTDQVLHDHFPGKPVMPGTLITESAAQLAGMLIELSVNQDTTKPIRRAVLIQIDKMKFHQPSRPGDRLDIQATVKSLLPEAAQVQVDVIADKQRRARGMLSFSLIQLDLEEINRQRQNMYRIWTEDLHPCPLLR